MVRLTLHKVNAFTVDGVAATGNPAAVCLLESSLLGSMTASLRQSVATDINLSETAYIEAVDPQACPGPDVFQQQDTFKLRWFTPAREVPLCGHATLASAATIFTACGNPSPALHFQTLSGTLTVMRKMDRGQDLLQMSLPDSAAVDPLPPQLQPQAGAEDSSSRHEVSLQQLLGSSPRLRRLLHACLCTLPTAEAAAPAAASPEADNTDWLVGIVEHVGYVAALQYLLVVLKPGLQLGRKGLEALQPDPSLLKAAASSDILIGVIVAVPAAAGEEGGYDFYSRFFAPWAGIAEDPVTGSAHAVLAPYWSGVLGKPQLFARQCSERGGDVWMDCSAEPGRVVVSGEAVIQETWQKEYRE